MGMISPVNIRIVIVIGFLYIWLAINVGLWFYMVLWITRVYDLTNNSFVAKLSSLFAVMFLKKWSIHYNENETYINS